MIDCIVFDLRTRSCRIDVLGGSGSRSGSVCGREDLVGVTRAKFAIGVDTGSFGVLDRSRFH
jgi:hypothetical protein